MKATKIVGVILGALMVAALFTGAVAASNTVEKYPIGDVYFFGLYNESSFTSNDNSLETIADTTWTTLDGKSVTFVKEDGTNPVKYYIAGTADDAGVYYYSKNGKTYYMDAKMPSAVVTGKVYDSKSGNVISSLISGTANTNNGINLSVVKIINQTDPEQEVSNIFNISGLMFTNPDGTLTASVIPDAKPAETEDATYKYYNFTSTKVKAMDVGTWTVQAYFQKGHNYGFSTLAPSTMLGEKYTFTIVSAETSKKLVASEETITQGGYVTVTVTAPYGNYLVKVTENAATIPEGQDGVNVTSPYSVTNASLHVGTSGEKSFVVKSLTTDDIKIKLYSEDNKELYKEITVKVKAGAITATAEKDSVYIGDEFTIDGTNDLGGTLYFFIKGTNFQLTNYSKNNVAESAAGKTWTIDVDTAEFKDKSGKKPDAGTYTIYIAKYNAKAFGGVADYVKEYIESVGTDAFDNTSAVDAYTTVSVALIQPFITVSTQDSVVQGEKLEITGTAEGNPKNVLIYIFGTNFFNATTASVLDDGTYSVSQKIVASDKTENGAWSMATGQYYLVAQHPMYDKVYNIAPVNKTGGTYDIMINQSVGMQLWINGIQVNSAGGNNPGNLGTILFNTNDRQSANAAYALTQAISDENIDDMQAHRSFQVAGPTSYVNAVPSQVTKGQKLTISGTTTGHKNDIVAVELLSTAFSAISKESAGSSAFATLTTRIGDDGVWSVSFDTTNMNVDDYTVSIAVGSLDPVTAKTKIVAGSGSTPVTPTTTPTVAPTAQPTAQPTTTPKTPGFGALAALAGLGAVAVLLLRRE